MNRGDGVEAKVGRLLSRGDVLQVLKHSEHSLDDILDDAAHVG